MKITRKKKEPTVSVEEKEAVVAEFKPAPVKQTVTEQRDGFGIEWFANERDASDFHRTVRQRGDVYGAGPLKGMSCGREPTHDRDGLCAVTFNKA